MYLEEENTPIDLARLNAAARSLGFSLGVRDLGSVAKVMQVTLRTVERWVTASGQQRRNIAPKSMLGETWYDLPGELQLRWLLAACLLDEGAQRDPFGEEVGQLHTWVGTVIDRSLGGVFNLALSILEGYREPFLSSHWVAMAIVNEKRGVWNLQVTYTRVLPSETNALQLNDPS